MRKELVFEDIRLFLCKHADHDVDYNTLIVTIFFRLFSKVILQRKKYVQVSNMMLYWSTDVAVTIPLCNTKNRQGVNSLLDLLCLTFSCLHS